MRFKTSIDYKRCKKCFLCLNLCPKKVIQLNKEKELEIFNQEKCIGCRLCEKYCPDFAIKVEKNE